MRPEIAELPQPEVIDIPELARAYADGEVDLICVLGPTASGKTKYAVRLARELSEVSSPLNRREVTSAHQSAGRARDFSGGKVVEGGKAEGVSGDGIPRIEAEIISADSRQVFRGMDIGTGKDLAEYGEVPYHLIDILPAGGKYNVWRYQQDFLAAYRDIRSRGCIPILCGGTGLYVTAVTCGYDFEKNVPLSAVKDMSQAREGAPAGDGAASASLPRRTFFIGTLVSREERVARIDRRLDERLAEGMVDEIRGLLESGVPAERLISYGLEYRYVTLYLQGQMTYEEMRRKLAIEIHRFAKRQMTWCRGMERGGVKIHWTEV